MNLKVFVCHYFFFVSEQLFCLIYLNQLQRLKFNIYFALSESLTCMHCFQADQMLP